LVEINLRVVRNWKLDFQNPIGGNTMTAYVKPLATPAVVAALTAAASYAPVIGAKITAAAATPLALASLVGSFASNTIDLSSIKCLQTTKVVEEAVVFTEESAEAHNKDLAEEETPVQAGEVQTPAQTELVAGTLATVAKVALVATAIAATIFAANFALAYVGATATAAFATPMGVAGATAAVYTANTVLPNTPFVGKYLA
jgi:hypothetical protein